MLKILLKAILALTSVSQPAARTMVLRASADHYAMVGMGTVETLGCTISAEGKDHLDAVVRGQWITFYDRNDEVEGTCKLGHNKVLSVKHHDLIVRKIATSE